MGLGTAILIFIMVIILIGLIIWVLLIIYTPKPYLQDLPIIFHTTSHYTNGSAYGAVLSQKMTPEGKMAIDYEPRDIGINKFGDINPERLICNREQLEPLFRGNLSDRKNLVIVNAPNVTQMHPGFKSTSLGKALMNVLDDKEMGTVKEDLKVSNISTLKSMLKTQSDKKVIDDIVKYLQRYYVQHGMDAVKDKSQQKIGIPKWSERPPGMS